MVIWVFDELIGKRNMPKKMKELSVGVEEPPQQQQIPRKRGRPRKIAGKIESGEIEEAETELKKVKMSEEAEEQQQQETIPRDKGRPKGENKSEENKIDRVRFRSCIQWGVILAVNNKLMKDKDNRKKKMRKQSLALFLICIR